MGQVPPLLAADFLPTAAGLLAIPAIIVPLDILAHFVLNNSFRRVKAAALK